MGYLYKVSYVRTNIMNFNRNKRGNNERNGDSFFGMMIINRVNDVLNIINFLINPSNYINLFMW